MQKSVSSTTKSIKAVESFEDQQLTVGLRDELDTTSSRVGVDDDLAFYARSAGPLLTVEQEYDLSRRIKRGDRDALTKLVESNGRLVTSIARNYLGFGLPIEDLCQEGQIGLMTASERFDPSRGYRFSTYATHWIRQAISRAISNTARIIRLPAHVDESLGALRRRMAAVDANRDMEGLKPATPEEMARELKMTFEQFNGLIRAGKVGSPSSLEDMIGGKGGDEGTELGELIPSDKFDPAEELDKTLVREELFKSLKGLSPRHQEILTLRFGLNGDDPKTLEEVGRKLHLTRERVRQLELEALEKLRKKRGLHERLRG